MLTNISIVLVETSHPGNIGSCARALKTMSLENLILVNPKLFPHDKAIEMASGAQDVLTNATVVATLDDALADQQIIFGTSARDRSLDWPMLTPKQMAELIHAQFSVNKIALVFGRENSGLNNTELQKCHYHVQIPANPEYSSLNLSQAVQVLSYEIYSLLLAKNNIHIENENKLATALAAERFYEHLEKVLFEIEFLKPNQPNRIMQRLRRLFQRSQLEVEEIDILRGILTEVRRLYE